MSSSLYGPAGNSLFIPTGPAPSFESLLVDDPWYKQQLTWLADAEKQAQAQLAQEKSFAEQMFALNQQQAQQGTAAQIASGNVALGNAQAQADFQKAQAAAENAKQAEYLREWMASRGLADSGQRTLEANELGQAYGSQLQGIDLGLQGTRSTIGQEQANAQANLQLQLQQLLAQNQNAQFGFTQQAETIPQQFARERGQAAFDTFKRLSESGRLNAPGVNAIWDPESGLYVTANGEYYGVDANGTPYKTTWARPVATPAAPVAPVNPAGQSAYEAALTGGQSPYVPEIWYEPPPPPGEPPNVPVDGYQYPYYYGGQAGSVYAE